MKLTVQSRINVSGQWWDIETEHQVDNDKPSDDKVTHIEWVIRGLAKTGKIISRVGANEQAPLIENSGRRPTDQPAGGQASFTWPAPKCKVHEEDMVESKTQKTEGHTQYYCPKRIGEGYCKQRAKVDVTSAIPTFWEVRG